VKIGVIPTGALSIDLALGVGGLPAGACGNLRPGISGKTTVMLHVIANASAPAAWPRSSTPSTRSTRLTRDKLGVNLNDLLVSQPTAAKKP
jgi:recombination protein RecA